MELHENTSETLTCSALGRVTQTLPIHRLRHVQFNAATVMPNNITSFRTRLVLGCLLTVSLPTRPGSTGFVKPIVLFTVCWDLTLYKRTDDIKPKQAYSI